MGFYKDFIWGAASASYQIEGAWKEDGKGLSIWDVFTREKGRIADDTNGDSACDHYHRYQEDVDIMKEIGLRGYRFSISWPRILPEGTIALNEKGIDFYDRLIDSLLSANITPFATLFHWDFPYELFKKGGWLNNDSPRWFADYAAIVGKRLGDRLKYFLTLNEPQCFIGLSYDSTFQAPGIHFPLRDTLQMAHHVLLAHGHAVQALRGMVKNAAIGFAPTGGVSYPHEENAADVEAARKSYFDLNENLFWSVSLWSDPVFLGNYPEELYEKYAEVMPEIGVDDLKIINEPLDFLGQNVYNGKEIKSDGRGGYVFVPRKPGYAVTANKWPVTPEALYWGPRFLAERYKKPIYITENGLSCADVVSLDRKVHDPGRIDFLNRYLLCLKKATHEVIDIRGYFHWCLTDNFEWAKGYTDRMGLVYCDFETQKRILKDSAHWYREVILSNGENL
jgi:beta-glucosidase